MMSALAPYGLAKTWHMKTSAPAATVNGSAVSVRVCSTSLSGMFASAKIP
jgi:hypothetical protein